MDNILEKIYSSGLRLLEPLVPAETYKIIVNEAIKLVGGDEGRILLKSHEQLELVYASSKLAASIRQVRKQGFAYSAFSQRKAFLIHTKDHPEVHPHMANGGVKSAIFIPLSYRKKSMGVLVVHSFKQTHFTQKELDILKLYGSFASLAIRKTQLYDETKNALETRDVFISMAAHELRTPLTAIHGYAQLLNSRLGKSDNVEGRWSNSLLWECQRLTLLVNELLEINKIKSGKIDYFLKQCSLGSIIDRAVNNFNLRFPGRELLYTDSVGAGSDIAICDFDKLLQVFNNLLENAGTYSKQETKVAITLTKKDSHFVIKVTDKGKGIPKNDLPFIFERFYRGKNHTNEGMGIGLHLVKEIIKHHHGQIRVKSKENIGTTFDVIIPEPKL